MNNRKSTIESRFDGIENRITRIETMLYVVALEIPVLTTIFIFLLSQIL